MRSTYRIAALTLGLVIAHGFHGASAHAQTGACCLGQGQCAETDATTCANSSGVYGGNGSQCPTEFTVTAHLGSGPTDLYLRPAVDCANVGTTGPDCVADPLVDGWMTVPLGFGEDTCHQFGGFLESPPIPADFFEPGSDPFNGQVCFLGQPLGNTQFGDYGEADTLILRSDDPFDRCDAPFGPPAQIEIEIVALQLVSSQPITVMVSGNPTQWDVVMDISTLGSPPGQLTATKTHCNGGTYSSFLPIQPRFAFTKVAGTGVPIGSSSALDTGLEGIPSTSLNDNGSPWVHDLDEGLSTEPDPPICTEFHPGIEDPDPPANCPDSQVADTLHLLSPSTELWLDSALVCLNAPTSGFDCIPGPLIDAWETAPPGTGQDTCHTFGVGMESPPIPADFFEPGSDPFTDQVCLVGEPLGSTGFGTYEVADTLVQRSADPFDRCELPGPTQNTVDIEIVELNLRSIEPITVQVSGSPTFWDVTMDLSTVAAPLGTLGATKTHCNGGTYSALLPVQPRFTFTKVAGPGIPIGSFGVLDTGLEGTPPVQLAGQGNPPWVTDADPLLRLEAPFCTDFHPGIEDPAAPTDCDCNSNAVSDSCDIEEGTSKDCNDNIAPDECESISGGDFDGDGDVNLNDYISFEQCLGGPDAPPGGLPECVGLCLDAFDEDNDTDIDLHDGGAFTRNFTN